jgi:pyrimidine-nucleoside phosphorylase
MIDIIETKRDGAELSTAQIDWFIEGYTEGSIPDYQAAALLMAVYLRGMTRRETADLTLAMANSGDQLYLHDITPFVVDKHSSGGIGDKTSLVVLPAVAACGVPVGKMSGRGLGSSGGTLDKMESIPGWSANISTENFKKQLAEIGFVLSGQTARLAPADGRLYSLRDVTGTVGSVPLIAASIMSKKISCGGDAVVLDVKLGSGAFMSNIEEARELAQIMVDIGHDSGRKTVALLADMNQPLGHAVGNALEVREAVETLGGGGPESLWEHCVEVGAHMLQLAGKARTLSEASNILDSVRMNGKALAKFREMVAYQGGDPAYIDDPTMFKDPAVVQPVLSENNGYIRSFDAEEIGWSCVRLGAGRMVKGDAIDYSVGMVIPVKVGDKIERGDLIATIYAPDEERGAAAVEELTDAVELSEEPVDPLPLFYGTIE